MLLLVTSASAARYKELEFGILHRSEKWCSSIKFGTNPEWGKAHNVYFRVFGVLSANSNWYYRGPLNHTPSLNENVPISLSPVLTISQHWFTWSLKRRTGDKPLPEPMLTQFTDAWIKSVKYIYTSISAFYYCHHATEFCHGSETSYSLPWFIGMSSQPTSSVGCISKHCKSFIFSS